ncbi:16636_t:CDS:2 [Gigaspora margarita]|uniref:16636_t:CDS:1 n=1 Tax=Gigaspora margarita TaxID=4874 RepID=A0ABN7V449_GIGMA|nr:16636_t:CDS:2 [Gigaspora margarita]
MEELDEISDVYNFSLINRRSFENSKPILKICKKIVKYGKIFDDHQIRLSSLYNMFDDICSDKPELFRRVYCNCRILAKLSIVKRQNRNEGRYFYMCDNQRCSFFKWLDDEYKEIFDDFNLIDSSIYDDIYLDYAHIRYIREKTGSEKSFLGERLFKYFGGVSGPYNNKIKNYLKKQNQQVFPEILYHERITKRYFNKYKEINFVYLQSWVLIEFYPVFFQNNINFIIKCEGDYRVKPFVLKYHFEKGNEKELKSLINKELS